jgi:hypothetical protein
VLYREIKRLNTDVEQEATSGGVMEKELNRAIKESTLPDTTGQSSVSLPRHECYALTIQTNFVIWRDCLSDQELAQQK